MLPSFRLIAATFLCGFLMVFAGLRLASSLNDFHEALPVMAAHAAPISAGMPVGPDFARGPAMMPPIYDLRFSMTPVGPTLVSAVSTQRIELPDAPLSLAPPMVPSETPTVVPQTAVPADTPVEATPAPISRTDGQSANEHHPIDTPQIAPLASLTMPPEPPTVVVAPVVSPNVPLREVIAALPAQPEVKPFDGITAEPLMPESDAPTGSIEPSDQASKSVDEPRTVDVVLPPTDPRSASTEETKAKSDRPQPRKAAAVTHKKKIRIAHKTAQAAPDSNFTFNNSTSPFASPR